MESTQYSPVEKPIKLSPEESDTWVGIVMTLIGQDYPIARAPQLADRIINELRERTCH